MPLTACLIKNASNSTSSVPIYFHYVTQTLHSMQLYDPVLSHVLPTLISLHVPNGRPFHVHFVSFLMLYPLTDILRVTIFTWNTVYHSSLQFNYTALIGLINWSFSVDTGLTSILKLCLLRTCFSCSIMPSIYKYN